MMTVPNRLLFDVFKLPLELGDDLFLNLIEEEDAPRLYSVTKKNEHYLRQWLGWLGEVKTEKDSLDYIQRFKNHFLKSEAAVFGIFDSENLIGTCGYNSFDWVRKITVLGYWLAEDYQGKGIVTRSCKMLTDLAFNQLGMQFLEIRIAPGNLKSKSIPIRLGFHYVATVKNAEWLYDHYVDHEIFRMSRLEWTKKTGEV